MVRGRVGHEPLQGEARAAGHDDVGAPVGETVHVGELRHAPHPPRRQVALPHAGDGREDGEAPVAAFNVGEQLSVAGLEEVQRERGPRKEHDAQRKDRETGPVTVRGPRGGYRHDTIRLRGCRCGRKPGSSGIPSATSALMGAWAGMSSSWRTWSASNPSMGELPTPSDSAHSSR